MKKMICALLIALVAGAAFGQMDDRTFSVSTVTTNVGTKAYVLRGELESVYVTARPATCPLPRRKARCSASRR